ncbi:MAG: helicase C-terminal domain-containing protein [Planctomycetota bacterium]
MSADEPPHNPNPPPGHTSDPAVDGPLDPLHTLGEAGPIARRLGDRFEARPQQLDMARAIDHALRDGTALLAEAGTGVGKSFAYLVPAIAQIVNSEDKDHRPKIVVSTHTIALQEQLIEKDLPLLNAVIPHEFTAVLVKGRGNYISRRRAARAWERQAQLFDESGQLRSLEAITDWLETTTDGSLATLPQLPSPSVWSDVRSDNEDCMGKRCPSYETCFYQSARRRMMRADLLVVNHALFFADLAMRAQGFGVLPPYDAVVLDEAHTIEDVAADYFGLSVSHFQVSFLLGRLYNERRGKGLLANLIGKGVDSRLLNRAIELASLARSASDHFFDDLASWQETRGRSNGRLDEPPPVDNTLTEPLTQLSLALYRVKDELDKDEDRMEMASFADRARGCGETLKSLMEQSETDHVYWIEVTQRRGFKRVKLQSSPIEVGPLLRQHLFEAKGSRNQPLPVVLTSATLATAAAEPKAAASDDSVKPGGRSPFHHLAGRVGADGAVTIQLGSPFRYAEQAELYVAPRMPDPKDKRFFDALVPAVLEQLDATDGGAFVLFTSYALLRKAGDALAGPLRDRGMPLHIQGNDVPRNQLLDRFKHDQRSVLLGTDSFWQGVDVPGPGLRNVIITRLPFTVPDRPLIEARTQKIESRGGSSFFEYSLPEAVLKFKQGFGRLIRTATDTGRVVVLDPRIVSKSYGKKFIAALPELPIRDICPPEDLQPENDPDQWAYDEVWSGENGQDEQD